MIRTRRAFNPRSIKLVVFDLDGTLIDSRLDLVHSVNAALRHIGRPRLPDDVIASYVGDGAPILIQRALGGEDHLIEGRVRKHILRETFRDTRTIDGGLGHYGARDDTRITDECIDGSIGQWRAKYATAPMPMATGSVTSSKPVDWPTARKIRGRMTAPPS